LLDSLIYDAITIANREMTMEYTKGQKGYFGRRKGEKTYGEIVKVNRKTLKVKQLEARGTQKSHEVGTVWTVPKTLWTSEGNGRPAYVAPRQPEAPKPKRPEAEILRDLRGIECALSPENLHCDGEISLSAARRKGVALRRQRRELVQELGREPTVRELYGE
jgi:hypothetical protein